MKKRKVYSRSILDTFNNKDSLLDTIEITGLVLGKRVVDYDEIESTRRTLRKLVKAGYLVNMPRHRFTGWRRYALPEKAEQYCERFNQAFGKYQCL